jgi:hypothetical protein
MDMAVAVAVVASGLRAQPGYTMPMLHLVGHQMQAGLIVQQHIVAVDKGRLASVKQVWTLQAVVAAALVVVVVAALVVEQHSVRVQQLLLGVQY